MARSTMPMMAFVAAFTIVATNGASFAEEPAPPSWSDVKCARYKKAWSELLARRGTQGLGPDFLARHDAFLNSNCTRQADVCPRSAEELDVANMMVIAAMNGGTASTFPPFACRK